MQSVRDPGELSLALELCHGRWFSAEDVLYDPEAAVLSISLARRATEEAPLLVRNLGWLYRRWRIRLLETVLHIRRVTDHRIAEGAWRLEALGFWSGTFSVYAAERPVVRAEVEALDLAVEETPNLVGERVESCALGFLRGYEIRRTA
jgi:hypothetical protein